MKSPEQYIESLRQLKRKVYIQGQRVENVVDHPLVRPSLNALAMTFALAQDPEYQELATAKSHLSGHTINRFTHIHQSNEDLIKKVKLQRVLGQKTGCCFQRCVGFDAMNAVYSTSFEIDADRGTSYHQRFLNFLRYVQDNDLVVDGAMTDPKGDRSRRPHQQADGDLFVHVVEKRDDGIVVRGAKCHQTGALNSHEILVMPTLSMREEDADYAVCFAVPADAPGITFILGRQASDTRKLEPGNLDVGNAKFGGHEAFVIFDNVFVPWERVFMCGEYEYAGRLVERFAGYHRQSYGGCKVGVGDVLIGATASVAEYNGVENSASVKDKITEMIHLNETLYACGLACSLEGKATRSGNYLVDLLLANVCKLNVTRFPYEIARLAEDVAGGLMVTMPFEADLRNPETAGFMQKYFCGVDGVSVEDRLRMLRLIENLTLGPGAVAYRTESMHGAGSPQAQRIMITRQADMAEKKKLARALAGIEK